MFEYLKNILTTKSSGETGMVQNKDSELKKLQTATCALFIEMANADSDFTDEERTKIILVMQKLFSLDREFVEELIQLSEMKIKKSISLYEFTSIINVSFSKDEKFELLKNLWRLIYVDEKLDMHEDQLVKKIGAMLNLEHRTIISAKLLVKEELKAGKN